MSDKRDKQVSTYVDSDTKDQLKREAKQQDVPLSTYIRDLIQQARLEDTQEQLARDLNAEERLLEIVAEGKDEIAEMSDQVNQQNQLVANLLAKFGAYPIVNFQLLKAAHSPSEATINDWFAESSQRLRNDIEDTSPFEEPVVDPYGSDSASEETTTGGAENETEPEDETSLVDELR